MLARARRPVVVMLTTIVVLSLVTVSFGSDRRVAALAAELDTALQEGLINRVDSVLEELAGIGTVPAVAIMLKASVHDHEGIYMMAEDRLATVDVTLLREVYDKLRKSKKPRLLETAALIQVAGKIESEQAEQWLVHSLESGDDMVKRNAIEILDRRRSKLVIPVLIEILDERKKRPDTIALMAREALVSLTGHDFDLITDWKNFWEANKEHLDPENLGQSDGLSGVALKTPGDAAEFFGVKIVSKRVIFVTDISGSMDAYDSVKAGQSWQDRQRLPRTKRELSNAIRRLGKDARFNIIAFNNGVHRFEQGLVPASGKYKKKALVYVRKLRAVGGTWTDEGLREAFKDPHADTIILLSDGAPAKTATQGPSVLIPRIMQMVRKLNRLKKVKIFTFGFAGAGTMPPGDPRQLPPDHDPTLMVEFLKKLADENGGAYTPID